MLDGCSMDEAEVGQRPAAVPAEICVRTLPHPPSARRNVHSHTDEMCMPSASRSARRNVRSQILLMTCWQPLYMLILYLALQIVYGKTKTKKTKNEQGIKCRSLYFPQLESEHLAGHVCRMPHISIPGGRCEIA